MVSLAGLSALTYRLIPKVCGGGHFSVLALLKVGRFALGISGISLTVLLLTQIDKILLSKLLALSEFGYYTLAATIAGILSMLSGPVIQAWFPQLSELYASNNVNELRVKYHQGAQLISVFMGSAAIVLIIFAESILQLWTSDPELAVRSAAVLRVLALGNLINGLMWIPYQTQLAAGWTSLATRINVVSIIFIVPAILWATPLYGAIGAAWVWVGLNAGYVLIGSHFMYRKMLKEEKWSWFLCDLFIPLAFATIVAGGLSQIMTPPLGRFNHLIWLLSVSVATLVGGALGASYVRRYAMLYINKIYVRCNRSD